MTTLLQVSQAGVCWETPELFRRTISVVGVTLRNITIVLYIIVE